MSYDALDDFAGPGGWDEGARMVGLRTIGIEWDAAACQTAKAAGHDRIRADVVGYSPDGLVGDDGLIEIKSPRQKGHLATVLADQVPAEHIAQIQTGLLVSGRAWCDFISYNPGMAMWVKRVLPDPDWAAALVVAAEAFEQTVEQMVTDYRAAVRGLPMTERSELVVI